MSAGREITRREPSPPGAGDVEEVMVVGTFWRGLLAGSILGMAAVLFMSPETRTTSRRRLIDVAGESVRRGVRRAWKGIRSRIVRMVVS
ncbi:MAG: hypothetical protein AB1816_05435 [Bacillota bacterium]